VKHIVALFFGGSRSNLSGEELNFFVNNIHRGPRSNPPIISRHPQAEPKEAKIGLRFASLALRTPLGGLGDGAHCRLCQYKLQIVVRRDNLKLRIFVGSHPERRGKNYFIL
jgi:hypothetical protein